MRPAPRTPRSRCLRPRRRLICSIWGRIEPLHGNMLEFVDHSAPTMTTLARSDREPNGSSVTHRVASAICFRLFVHWMRRAASRADCTAGKSRAIKTAMIAITTNSSIRVKPSRVDRISYDLIIVSSLNEMNGFGVSQLCEGTMMRELGYMRLAGEREPQFSTDSRHMRRIRSASGRPQRESPCRPAATHFPRSQVRIGLEV